MSDHYYMELNIDMEIFPEEYLHVESEDTLRDVLFDRLIEAHQINAKSVDYFPFKIDEEFIDEWLKLKHEQTSD